MGQMAALRNLFASLLVEAVAVRNKPMTAMDVNLSYLIEIVMLTQKLNVKDVSVFYLIAGLRYNVVDAISAIIWYTFFTLLSFSKGLLFHMNN